jgi:hypothetical protein
MWWESLAFTFIKALISGEIWRLWAEHKEREKAQTVANAPVTKDELLTTLREGEL